LEGNNYKIELLENINDINELKNRENQYISDNICVNKYRAYRTNEDKANQKKKDYEKFKTNNPEKIKEYQDKRNIMILCSCGKNICKRNIARHIKTHKLEQ